LREVQSGIVFTNGPIFQLFAPQGRHFEPVEVKFGMANRTLGKPKQVSAYGTHPSIFRSDLLTGHRIQMVSSFFRLKYLIVIKIFNRD